MRDTARQSLLLAALIFTILSAIALAIVTLVAGSIFGDYPWQVYGWLILGLVIAWWSIVAPCCLGTFPIYGLLHQIARKLELEYDPEYEYLLSRERPRGDGRSESERRLMRERLMRERRLMREHGLLFERGPEDKRSLEDKRKEEERRLDEGHLLATFEAISRRLETIQLEIHLIDCLIVLASAAYLVSYFSSRIIFNSMQQQRFGPAETAQVITAIGGLGLAVGTSIAAIIKAYALLLRARADVIRARSSLVPGEQQIEMERIFPTE